MLVNAEMIEYCAKYVKYVKHVRKGPPLPKKRRVFCLKAAESGRLAAFPLHKAATIMYWYAVYPYCAG